ncbi:MAG TPA: penicillin-binding transpeptidase domain-containing protein [Acidimicrobiales bacterium]|nr:penicillin-binding transpeptidase domain-containing protein [Acidimicrobiales bacterium]
MGRRIRWLGIIMVACLGLVVAQLVNIQLVKAKSLQNSPDNPRVAALRFVNPRGEIVAADGTVLAKSVPTPAATKAATGYPYQYLREYPDGPLYAAITGYDSALYYGQDGIELEYDSYLGPHHAAPQTLSQLLFRQNTPLTTDSVKLTIEPALQQYVWDTLTNSSASPPGANKDGAVVVIQPSTGDILAMVSNPTFDPNALVDPSLQAERVAYYSYIQPDHEGFYPLRPIATREFFPPGSTMKVVTSTAVYNLKPSLAGFNYPVQQCQTFADSNIPLCDLGGPCGGTMLNNMLPASCDPGYAELGVQLGVPVMTKQAELFGYNAVPGIDLPGTIASVFPNLPANSQAYLGQSSIGQYDVRTTALQNAMVAAGVANGGVLMTPHLMSSIRDSQGAEVASYTPKAAALVSDAKTAQQVTALMEAVATSGTAAGVGFPSYLCAAVKTGTAQTTKSNPKNDTWMIGFAPANHPQVAVAVVVPQQDVSSDGAHIAGPIMNRILQYAVPQSSVSEPCTVAPLPDSTFTSLTSGTSGNSGH